VKSKTNCAFFNFMKQISTFEVAHTKVKNATIPLTLVFHITLVESFPGSKVFATPKLVNLCIKMQNLVVTKTLKVGSFDAPDVKRMDFIFLKKHLILSNQGQGCSSMFKTCLVKSS
jgi:hypothetical protein